MRQTKPISITPKPDCKTCDGNGMMKADRVPAPFGPGTVALPEEFCHCVVDQLPAEDEDYAPEDFEIFLRFPKPAEPAEPETCPHGYGFVEQCPTCKDRKHDDEDLYDYAADDRNFDADRERRSFRR